MMGLVILQHGASRGLKYPQRPILWRYLIGFLSLYIRLGGVGGLARTILMGFLKKKNRNIYHPSSHLHTINIL